jgi:hypothetical protein
MELRLFEKMPEIGDIYDMMLVNEINPDYKMASSGCTITGKNTFTRDNIDFRWDPLTGDRYVVKGNGTIEEHLVRLSP